MKAKRKPEVPLKNLMWTIIKDPTGTIWERIDDTDDLKTKLDKKWLEDNFCTKPKLPVNSNTALNNGANVQSQLQVPKGPQVVQLLDPARRQTVELMLGQIKVDFSVIGLAMMQCDDSILSQNLLLTLYSICPEEEEIRLIKEYEGDKRVFYNLN